MIEKHVPACTDKVLAKFGYQKSAKQWAKTYAQSYTFLLNDDGPAAVLPLRPAAALCVKMEKKANRKKKTDDEAIKRKRYYFIMEIQAGICRWPLVYLSSVQMQSQLQ